MITTDETRAPSWTLWAPRALPAWALLYGAVQAYWALTGGAPSMSPVGIDLIVFSGWKAVALCLAAVAITLAFGWAGERIAVRRVLLAGAWTVSGALVVAAALFLLDVVGGLLPGIGVRFFPAGFLSRTACLAGALLMGAVALTQQRRIRGGCASCGRVEDARPPVRTPVWAAFAATAGCVGRIIAQLIVGFDAGPLGVGVDAVLFEVGFVLAGTLLPWALVFSWGTVFPRWVPGLAGRRVPRWLVLGPGAGISVAMTVYFGMILTNMVVAALGGVPNLGFGGALPDAFYWVSVPMYCLWGVMLGVAAIAYGRRTRPRCHRCGR
ncbi:hypothetical protein [Streptosporangium sp. NPDC000396]|uniref:hypothetical protein n=1 Tax=Streptosporangium sp. NPDC000396 TaxID=3366185 RepID=UPI0036CD449B